MRRERAVTETPKLCRKQEGFNVKRITLMGDQKKVVILFYKCKSYQFYT